SWLFGRLVLSPTQRLGHSGQDSIRLARMPVVVKAPNHHAILFNEISLGLVNLATQIGRFVGVVIKGRLMRDDQILFGGMRPLTNVERRAERSRDALDDCVRIANFESVHSFAAPWDADVFLNAFDHLSRRDSFKRGCGASNGIKPRSGKSDEAPS